MRLVLALTFTRGWSIRQIDISNTFLHGKLEERIVVSQPYGFQDPAAPDHVCLLCRSLYGLKKSPQCWFKRLRDFLSSINFLESKVDPSLFLFGQGSSQAHLFVYVDDIVITRLNDKEITRLVGLFLGIWVTLDSS